MKDYHQRFRERFKNTNPALWNWMPSAVKVDDILAFIDEIVAEERGQAKASGRLFGYEAGRKDERASLIEKVEGMTVFDYCENDGKEIHWRYRNGYNQALDDLLTHLRCPDQDGCAENPRNLPPLQSEREMRVYLVREDDLVKREKLHSDAGIREETDWSGWIRQGDYEIARPKENTTPQSREQGGGCGEFTHVGHTSEERCKCGKKSRDELADA